MLSLRSGRNALGRYRQMVPAFVAELTVDHVFMVAFRATVFYFTRGHRDKKPCLAFYDFYIPDYKRVVDGYCGIRPQFIIRAFLGKNPYLCYFHMSPLLVRARKTPACLIFLMFSKTFSASSLVLKTEN